MEISFSQLLNYIFVNTENEVIFIKMNTLDKTRVICLLQRRVLRDAHARKNHWQVTKK